MTYTARRRFRDDPPIWYYDQTPEQLGHPPIHEVVHLGRQTFEAWSAGSGYPDHFFGDPHINYYEGTAEFDDLKRYLPAEAAED